MILGRQLGACYECDSFHGRERTRPFAYLGLALLGGIAVACIFFSIPQ